MKKSSVLGVLAAVILSLFLTGCESAEEKQARLQEIERLQMIMSITEESLQRDKHELELSKNANPANLLMSVEELENMIKEKEEGIERTKAKLKELQ
jgi:uncharacterized small protein (DUF1192 family)